MGKLVRVNRDINTVYHIYWSRETGNFLLFYFTIRKGSWEERDHKSILVMLMMLIVSCDADVE